MQNLMSNMRFMLLWSLGSIVSLFSSAIVTFLLLTIAGFVAIAIWGEEITELSADSSLIFLAILFSSIGLVIGLIFGAIQKAILRMRTREPWRGWLIASAIGGVIAVDILAVLLFIQGAGYVMWMVMPPSETLFWFGFQIAVIFFACLALSQVFVLSHYVRGAWVWVLANIVAGVVLFSLLIFGALSMAVSPLITIILIFLVAASPGIVTGFSLVWLMSTNWRQGYY